MQWNLADVFELVADTASDRLALAHGDDGTTRSWSELDRRANALEHHRAATGRGAGHNGRRLREAHGRGPARASDHLPHVMLMDSCGSSEAVGLEEVEETLKLHPGVADATVVGLPDPKWGRPEKADYKRCETLALEALGSA